MAGDPLGAAAYGRLITLAAERNGRSVDDEVQARLYNYRKACGFPVGTRLDEDEMWRFTKFATDSGRSVDQALKDIIRQAIHGIETNPSQAGSVVDDRLQTWVDRMSYDWNDRRADIWCGGPVDMSGTIDFVLSIHTDAIFIQTYIDGGIDTAYRRIRGEWVAETSQRGEAV